MSSMLKSLALQADAGVYVGAKVEPFTAEQRKTLSAASGMIGAKVKQLKQLHVTVIFSERYVDHALVEPLLSAYKTPLKAEVTRAAALNSSAEDLATFALLLKCPELMELHAACKALGCTHIFPELTPHVSLFYAVPRALCSKYVVAFNEAYDAETEPLVLSIYDLQVKPLDPEWVARGSVAA